MYADLVFTVGGVLLAGLLLPTVVNSDSVVPRTTSVPTGAVLFVFGTTFISMGMYASGCMNILTGFMWLFIAAVRAPGA